MGIDWEEILGDADYEDVVADAADLMEEMQEQKREAELEKMEGEDSEEPPFN